MAPPLPCRTIKVIAFRGSHSKAFARHFRQAILAEKAGLRPGPSPVECLLHIGHAALSMDGGTTAYGFTAEAAGLPIWQTFDRLRNGEALPGVVRNDVAVYSAAQSHAMTILSFDILLPESGFQDLQASLDAEREKSQYSYSFPNGDGDCNCVTWLERMGLPLLTGRMREFARLSGISSDPRRRFGRCV
jgi:hypothetical protein